MIIKPLPLVALLLAYFSPIKAEGILDSQGPMHQAIKDTVNQENLTKKIKSFAPFTGKILKNKVRLRLHPQFDSPVIKEFHSGDLILVLDETEDFYVIQPSTDTKAYIFRTYVLDNVVEGTRVNVRLQPDLDAPVIAQLNSGDRAEGNIVSAQPKWLEIAIPLSARFYVAKEFVEKVGDANFITLMEKRREKVNYLLESTRLISEAELQKPFDQMKLDGLVADYQHIISDYKDFPETILKAQAGLKELQEVYLAKKMAYLELKAHDSSFLEQKTKQLSDELSTYKAKMVEIEQQMQREKMLALADANEMKAPLKSPTHLPFNMITWIPAEEALFKAWSEKTGSDSPSDFYREEKEKAFIITGVIEPYNRAIKNKPGDYMLIETSTQLPIAYLYSTQVNLQEYVGHEISVLVVPRPNNHYAFPAYFVFSIQ